MKKLLIVVDYQNDFVDGALGFPKAVSLDKKIAERVKKAFKDGWDVWYTKDTHLEDYLESQEGKRLPIPHTILNTPGHELYGETGKTLEDADVSIIKYTFGSDELIELLQKTDENMGEITEIELCGVVTNMCVISNAVIAKAALPDAKIVINAELCASFDDSLHEKALDVMEGMQMEIVGR